MADRVLGIIKPFMHIDLAGLKDYITLRDGFKLLTDVGLY